MEIKCPLYEIGGTGEGATRLLQDPEEPLPRCHIRFLNGEHAICAWFLANNSHNPVDIIVLESHLEDAEDPEENLSYTIGGTPFLT